MSRIPTELNRPLNQEDATTLLIRLLKEADYQGYPQYGYEFYLPSLLHVYLKKQHGENSNLNEMVTTQMSALYDAAWDFCRRGILRPGIRAYGAQGTADGASGNGYTTTPFGRKWLEEAHEQDFVPTEPGRFSAMLEPFSGQFGPAFQERAHEAIRCYGAHAYLACCAMCGAAAESILLASAIAKSDETTILKEYNAAGGRRRIENVILGKAGQEFRDEYKGYTTLLKYWRDQSSHGRALGISDNEAYTSLGLLLRFAIFVNTRWDEIVRN